MFSFLVLLAMFLIIWAMVGLFTVQNEWDKGHYIYNKLSSGQIAGLYLKSIFFGPFTKKKLGL
jgi:hypothetical protein